MPLLASPTSAPAFPLGPGSPSRPPNGAVGPRQDDVDATRAFVLLLGVVFHASLSFHPMFMGWAVQDVSTSPWIAAFVTLSHAFRMETFFLLAGLLGHRAVQRKNAMTFLRSRLSRLGVPFVAGWFVLRPLLVSGWILGSASLRGAADPLAALRGGWASLGTFPAGAFTGTHLWFLYYLCGATAFVLGLRGLARASGGLRTRWQPRLDAGVRWLASSAWAPLAAALPAACLLLAMRGWGMDTPDRSLLPDLPVFAVYAGYFALGWLLGRCPVAWNAFANPTPARGCWFVLGAAAVLVLGPFEGDPGHERHRLFRFAHALGYSVVMFTAVSLTFGIWRRICTRPRAWVRYLADASYWLYLVHLPIVVWLQVAVAELPVGWMPKLALISAATLILGLLSYDAFVRSTRLGKLLHGRRHDRILFPWLRRFPGFAVAPTR